MKMLQAKHRKVLWVLLLLWMLYLHKWFFDRFIYMDVSIDVRMGFYMVKPLLLVIWVLGVLVMGIRQLASYQHFRKKALERMYPVQASWMQSACQQAAEEAGCTDVPPLYQRSQHASGSGLCRSGYAGSGAGVHLGGASYGISA